uniref:Cation-transporting ATPase 13A3 n=1 Tax=Schistosoma mansoni TaxID=6183 RepID=A0A5K4FD07_SCHMA
MIDIILTPIIRLVLNGCLTPFHCFQVFICVIWYCVEYEIYATCIAVFSVISLIFQVYELHKNERALKRTVCISSKVGVFRCYEGEDDFMLVDSTELVPGDLIAIPSSGCLMQCDAVLLMGNCIVNESSLTGESLPITKIPLPNGQSENTTFDFHSCPRHILFSGTSVIQTRGDINKRVLAVVIRTGFMTTKGELVRSIMFPKPMKFKFTRDVYQFLGALCGVALVGLCVTIYLMYWNKKDLYYIILRPLDLVTIVIPPILPVAMSVGIVFAQRRLRKHGIYCINPSVMNVCGVISLTCFDKPECEPSKLDYGPLVECMATCHSLTPIDGVLSGDPLDVKMFQSTKWEFIEVISEDQHNFDLVISAIVRPKEDEYGDIFEYLLISARICWNSLGKAFAFWHWLGDLSRRHIYVLCACRANIRPVMVTGDHILTSISVARNCEMIDELDRVVIVTAHPPPCPGNENQPILVPNTGFSSETNPKNIQDPINAGDNKNFSDDLINSLVQFHYTEDLQKPVTEVTTTNIQLKRNLTKTDNRETSKPSFFKRMKTRFGFGRLQSSSKVLTASLTVGDVINKIDSKEIEVDADFEKYLYKNSNENRDSLSSQMIDQPDFHLALSGKTWSVIQEHYSWLIPKLVVKGTVFARFSPEQKAQVIGAFQSVGYFVSMCGDGANDCGALKVAHAGISLSEAEASIASPFTSKIRNISCVPRLISEGRCALITSFGMFKFMAGYSLIQSFSIMLLFVVGGNFSQWQYLHCDFVIITTLGLTFGYTHAYPHLSAEPPTMRLLSMVTMSSLFGQVIIGFIIQATAFILIRFQSWYMPLYSYSNISEFRNYESTSVFIVSAYQYIILAIAFSEGAPYRKSILTNFSSDSFCLVHTHFTLYGFGEFYG